MPETKITKNHFLYGQEKYFRGSAESIRLGDYGKKKDPIGPRAHLEIYDQVARDLLKGRVRYDTTAVIDWNRQTKVDVEAEGELTYLTMEGSGTATFSYEKAKSANLKLVKFSIVERDVLAILNRADVARKYLAGEGGDGRFVSVVWIVAKGELAESFSTAASSGGSISANVGKSAELELTANHSGSTSGSTTIVLKKRTTFAFAMHKVTNWDKGKTHVEDVKVDSVGMD